MSNNIISVSDGKHRIIHILIDEYINGINSIDMSMDSTHMCYYLNIKNLQHLLCVSKTAIKFLITLRGNTRYKKECEILDKYNIGIQPEYSEYIKKSIAQIKWLIYINIKNNNIDNNVINNIALLSGICLYFNELDLINYSIINKDNNNAEFSKSREKIIIEKNNNNNNFSNYMKSITENLYNITQKHTRYDI